MEAYITPPDATYPADPLARLLAAILEWLRAMLAEYQAGQLPPAPARRVSVRKTSESSENIAPAAEAPTRAPALAPALARPPVPPRTCVPHPRDMSAGLPRPRLVAPS